MNYKLGVLIIIVIIITGFIKILIKSKKVRNNISECENYRHEVGEFIEKIHQDEFSYEAFEYLNSQSYSIQKIIGVFGVAADYKPSCADYFIPNYQIIINEVNNLLSCYSNGFRKGISDSIIMIDSSIGKYIGYAENKRKKMLKDLRNPFVWIREGVRAIVTFPIFFLYWTGIIEYSNYNKIQNNKIIRFGSVFLGTLGFISTLITIITGYEPFMNIVSSFIK
ncbi:hypothetical protein SAMN02910355_0289 [Terrisporobacter glycolicus]|nr:hypothetical protein SAMN02910355_0289 [Terrisporobacter glycolicus]